MGDSPLKTPWREALNCYDTEYLGPIAFVCNIKNHSFLDSWLEKWDGKQHWLECLLLNTPPENTLRLLLKLGIYPKRFVKTNDEWTEIFCHYRDIVFMNEDDILNTNVTSIHVMTMSNEDWFRLVKAKSNIYQY